MSTMSLTVKDDLLSAISYNSEFRKEKVPEVNNIYAVKVFDIFLVHTIQMLGLKKCRNSVKEIVS